MIINLQCDIILSYHDWSSFWDRSLRLRQRSQLTNEFDHDLSWATDVPFGPVNYYYLSKVNFPGVLQIQLATEEFRKIIHMNYSQGRSHLESPQPR